jgi:hypothetical protein
VSKAWNNSFQTSQWEEQSFTPKQEKPFSFGNLYGKTFSFGRSQNFQLDPQKSQDMSQRSGPKR